MDGTDSESNQSSGEESCYSEENEMSDVWSFLNRHNEEYDDSPDARSTASSESLSYAYDYKEINKIPTTVPRLETMASIRVAIALWNRATVAVPGMLTRNREWQSRVYGEVRKWIDTLPIPKSFAKCLNQRFDRVKYDVNGWIYYHSYAVFFEDERKRFLYRYIDGIVWRLSDVNSVNFAETARNLLKSDKLTNVVKFRLASTYCLREEALKIWSTLKEDDIDVSIFFFPVIVYWKCYCSGKWDELKRESADQYMIGRNNANWAQIEYFFHRLDTEQQVEKTISLIDLHGVRFQELLLLKLNETQRVEVLTKKGVDIVRNYAGHDDDDGEKCIAIWQEVRYLITQEQFVSLFSDLLTSTHADDFILTEIWNTIPDDFKLRIINDDDYNFIKQIFQWFDWKREKGRNFISLVFSDDASADLKRKITKEQFFTEECIKLLAKQHHSKEEELLDHLIKSCLPEVAESTKFKKSLVKNPYYSERCEELVINRNSKALVELLDFGLSMNDPSWTQSLYTMLGELLKHFNSTRLKCYATGDLQTFNYFLTPFMSSSSYAEIVCEYKRNFLFSDQGLRVCAIHLGSNNSILPEIMVDGLPSNSIPEFKRRLIFSPEGIRKLEHLIANGQSSTMKKVINWCLQSGKARRKLKKQLKIV
ncbi:uncharacterized protein LOC135844396 isoform X6 [Planococcus citri]|uniref:uncharacterized protein LOC135844396 isoform X6 n=1 Tax=Planococcus citri TaxID=170843 RepID=UPI0031F92613